MNVKPVIAVLPVPETDTRAGSNYFLLERNVELAATIDHLRHWVLVLAALTVTATVLLGIAISMLYAR